MQKPESMPDNNTEPDGPIAPAEFKPLTGPTRVSRTGVRTGTLLVGAALLICTAIAWYIITGKSVYIETVPQGASVEITEGLYFKLADRYLLHEGVYAVTVSAEGYHQSSPRLTVSAEDSQDFLIELTRLPGHLSISSSPEVNASVWLNDQSYGTTPTTIDRLEPGPYRVRLTPERYFDFETEIEIEGMDREQSLTAELVPAWAEVRLESTPPGADIFVDDILVGNTPYTAELLQGEHELRIKLAGHKLWRKSLRVKANEPQQLTGIELQPADALVQIVTVPDGANITINGEYMGLSPLEAALSPGQTAVVNAFKPGYKQASRSLNPASGDNTSLRLSLDPETAQVRIIATPRDAGVYINGQASGLADQVVELPTTPHTIEIRKSGYISYKTEITPRPGIPQQVSAQLKTEEQARLDAIKPVIVDPAGETLRLFEPVSVVMGASRREPGRRANETIRNVQFSRRFYLGETEVTNVAYRKFDPSHESGEIQGNGLNDDRQPVVNVSWEDAARYCNWLSEKESLTAFYTIEAGKVTGVNPDADGYRLPTEAEWAWAARHRANGPPLKFPWGDEMPPKERSGNYADLAAAPIIGNIIAGYNDSYIVSAPVASFPANNRGIYDLGGNVAEWVNDYYDIPLASESETIIDPLGPETGEHHVIRGASWAHGSITELRLSFRDYGSDKRTDVGFRVARYIE